MTNSVLIKSEEVPLFGAGIAHTVQTILVEKLTLSKPGITAMATQRLLLIVPLTALLFYRRLREHRHHMVVFLILTGCLFLHLALASTGKFYRYEAYLVLCSVLAAGTVIFRFTALPRLRALSWAHLFAAVALFFLSFPLLLRASAAFTKADRACINIYEQQYQMGLFLKQYYPQHGVAANDIGAVSFYTNGRITDLWGLGSIEIARSRKGGYWNAHFLDSFSRKQNASVAIIYDSWFNNTLGARWQKVGSWQIPDNVVCGDDDVSFYAIDSSGAALLRTYLLLYQKRLPGEVKVEYTHLKGTE